MTATPHATLWKNLERATRALAQDAATQIALFPSFADAAEELGVDFGEALLALQRALSAEDLAAIPELTELDHQLGAISGRTNLAFWSDDALRSAEEWREIRAGALKLTGDMRWQTDQPPTGRAVYVSKDSVE